MKYQSVLLCTLAPLTALFVVACGGPHEEIISPVGPTIPTPAPVRPATAAITLVVRGAITSVTGSSRTIVVNGAIVTVASGAVIEDQVATLLTFSDLQIGQSVTVMGTGTNAAIVATKIVVEQRPAVVGLEGAVENLSGTCPAVTFTVLGVSVTTSSTTSFEGACGILANGVPIQVQGTQQANGAVAALVVSVTRNR